MKLKVTVEGDKKMAKKMATFPSQVRNIVEDAMVMALDEVYNRSLLAAPTHGQAASIRSTVYKDMTSVKSNTSVFKGEVGYKTVLAAYYEFGTGAYVDVPVGLEDYAMQFYVNGKGVIPAHAFLFPAFFSVRNDFIKDIVDNISKSWK